MHRFLLTPALALLLAGSTIALTGARGAETAATTTLDLPDRADGTPYVAAAGSFVAVAWGGSLDGKADVYVATSRDGGTTFGTPVRVNTVAGEARLGGELPPRVALHTPAGSTTPVVTVLWTARGPATEIKVARSRDGGQTFEAPTVLQTAGAAGDRGWPSLAVDAQGAAHAVWLDHRGLAARRAASGGAKGAAGGARHVHGAKPSAGAGDSAVMAQGSSIYHAALDTAARAEQAITAGVCYCCKTALAAGADGALFAAWRHVFPGDMRDMAMAVSRDGGKSFSSPARVSADGWAINGCPDDGPAVVVDGRGTAHVVWPTVIPGDSPEGAIFYASTSDGTTFTPRVRVPTLGSPKPMHPQITLGTDGALVVAWDEVIDGARVAAMRTLTVSGDGAPRFGATLRLAPQGAASHPVIAASDRGLVAVWATGGEEPRVQVRVLPAAGAAATASAAP